MLFLLLLVGVYASVLVRSWLAWRKLAVPNVSGETPPVFFSVIVPVRNEARNILSLLQDLDRQQYPSSHYEVIVVDDHSEDSTPELVRQFQQQSKMNLSLLFLSHFPGKRQKKAAVETGIRHSKGEWIACTDGDCHVSPRWLAALNQVRHEQQPQLISGPVSFAPVTTVWQQLQALEFSALIAMGAASIAERKPTMCNGANIAYSKSAFLAVNGFQGNEQVPSGDDEFLLHKIHRRYPGQIAFAKVKEALVETPATDSIRQFLHQRIRWASKWRHYDSYFSQVLALIVMGGNLAVLSALIAALVGWWPWWFLGIVLTTKMGADTLLLWEILGLFGKKRLLSLLWLLQLVYVPYMLFTAILGLRGQYHWKGRQLKTA